MSFESQVADLTIATTNLTSAVISQQTALDARIQSIIGAAPAALDTLGEIAAQLASDENAAGVLTSTVATKADQATTYTKTQVDGLLTAAGTSSATTAAIATKADQATTYTKTQVDGLLTSAVATKADQATTYTKTQVDGLLTSAVATKADQATTYTKTQVDGLLAVTVVSSTQTILTANYVLTAADSGTSFIVANAAVSITITIPTGLPNKMKASFIQQGTGDVAFVASGTVLRSPYNMFKIKGQNYGAYLEQINTSNTYQVIGKMKL